jgi:hypothetical protein
MAADIRAGFANAAMITRDCSPAGGMRDLANKLVPPTGSVAPSSSTWSDASPDQLQFIEAIRQGVIKACATKNPEPLVSAAADMARHAPRNCTVYVDEPESYTLIQLDSNTWQVNLPPAGTCHFSRVITLWQPTGPRDSSNWNYREVVTMPENAPQECKYEPPLTEYQGVGTPRQRWKLGCDMVGFPDK